MSYVNSTIYTTIMVEPGVLFELMPSNLEVHIFGVAYADFV